MRLETLLYDVAGPVATITLNRPERLNTIVPPMPDEFEAAVREATLDPEVKVIVLRGAGRAFCAGYDVGGGSDMALCADMVIASEDAQIGTPYSRIWGCYLSGLWIYRLGLTKAKEHALTGKPLSGREAADIELINAAVPFEELESAVAEQADQLASIPMSQVAALTPDAHAFIDTATREGVRAATAERDALFADYGMASAERRPDPGHVIGPD